MKNSYLLAFLFLISFSLSCQVRVGIKAGYTNTWMNYGDRVLPPNAETDLNRLNMGIVVGYDLNKYFSLEASPAYAEKGAACMPGFVTWQGDNDLLLDYLELPISASVRYPLREKYAFFLRTGYGLSYIIRATTRRLVSENPDNFIRSDVGRRLGRRVDHGIYGGGGIQATYGRNIIALSVDKYWGLRDVDGWGTSMNRSNSINVSVSQYIR